MGTVYKERKRIKLSLIRSGNWGWGEWNEGQIKQLERRGRSKRPRRESRLDGKDTE